jgi:class 3 adenylate cyclase
VNRVASWLRIATDRVVVAQALATATLVGILLTAINHGPALATGQIETMTALEIVLTFLTPYLVSTATSVSVIERQTRGEEAHLLLERQIEAILKFPDQNPNPVMRSTTDGQLLYANAASAPIRQALSVEVGDQLPGDFFRRLVEAAGRSSLLEVTSGWETYAVMAVELPDLEVFNIYGMDVTAAKVVEKFPDQNPNPVLRMDGGGTLIYANAASQPIVTALNVKVGDPVPADLREHLERRLAGEEVEEIEVAGEGQSFALTPVEIREFGFTNIYGTDHTALHAINKFPDENPNPVLRVSRQGFLTYANPASALVRNAWNAQVGDRLDDVLFKGLSDAADGSGPNILEAQAGGRTFDLLVVAVFEFDSINIYGTDVTAARLVARANAENERLLLNILPVTIADRLRQGEGVIADRFEEMSVLFADVVDFTPFASRLPAHDVVSILNEVFSIFDRLVDRHGLEKIKTIGDAYMVIGGLDAQERHIEAVADAGLEMIRELATYRTPAGEELQIRVGMHVGAAIGGVIGLKKFIYDVWGDTVNTASRMESHGVPGRVQVTEATRERLATQFECESRGIVDVKGKGPMQTYLLVGRRDEA